MSVRFRRSKSLGKIGKINLTKGGLGVSVGPKGLRTGVGPRGSYTSASIPGTGLYAINYAKKDKKTKTEEVRASTAKMQHSGTPKVLANPIGPVMAIIISVILLFIQPIIGVLALGGSVFWLVKDYKSPRAEAKKDYDLAMAAYARGETENAFEKMDKVLDYNPAKPEVLALLANWSSMLSDYYRSEIYLAEFLKLEPESIPAQFNYAISLSLNGKHDQAIEILQKLPTEVKQEVPVITALGYAFLESEKPEMAITVLEKGPVRKRNMDEETIVFSYVLGRAYKAAGQNKKAVTQLRKVYVTDSEFENVTELLAELGELD